MHLGASLLYVRYEMLHALTNGFEFPWHRRLAATNARLHLRISASALGNWSTKDPQLPKILFTSIGVANLEAQSLRGSIGAKRRGS